MTTTAIVTVLCPDKTGLVSTITAALWELGANLMDTSFSVLGGGADFSAVCELPDSLGVSEVEEVLGSLDQLSGAEIAVRPYNFDARHGPEGDVTHRITVSGGDQPGLVARLCETFVEFGANIVSLNAGPLAEQQGRYVIRLAVSIPDAAADACISTVTNTAEAIGLSCTADRF
jgi:glycine cleavage system transcriptional repressor